MPEFTADPALIARCGLYCGACGKYLKGRCPGCAANSKATWCKVRTCCAEQALASCADCQRHADLAACPHLNNVVARIFAVLFNSNRPACLEMIRAQGYDAFAAHMAAEKRQSLPR